MPRPARRRLAFVGLLLALFAGGSLATAGPAAAQAEHDPTSNYPESGDVTVRPGDTLYSIARTTLGDPGRYLEIFELNVGERQRDGGRLTDPGLLRVGWLLRLPNEMPDRGEPDPDDSLGSGRTHTVRAGETLTGIARDRLGDPGRYLEIFAINRDRPQTGGGALTDPSRLTVGWVLELPQRAGGGTGPGGGATARRHTVVAGDSLSGIARTALGDPGRYLEIFTLNQGRPQAVGGALTDPSVLRVGWVLRLPAP